MCNLLLSMMVVGAVQTGPNELTIQIMAPDHQIYECLVVPKPSEQSEEYLAL